MITKATRDVLDLRARPVTKLVVNNSGDPVGPRSIDATTIGVTTPDVGYFTNLQATAGNITTLQTANLQANNVVIPTSLNVTGATIIGLDLVQKINSFPLNANYTALVSDTTKTFLCNGSFVLSLDNVATLGVGWFIQVKNIGAGNVVVDPFSSQLIDGVSTITIGPGESCVIFGNGSTFYTLFHGYAFSGAVSPTMIGGTEVILRGVFAPGSAAENGAPSWQNRILNLKLDPEGVSTLVANTFTLPAGLWEITMTAGLHGKFAGASTYYRLYDSTTNTPLIYQPMFACSTDNDDGGTVNTTAMGFVRLYGNEVLSYQYYEGYSTYAASLYTPTYPTASDVAKTFASSDVNDATNFINMTNRYQSGSVVVATTSGTLPGGLTPGGTYWVVNATNTAFQLATSPGGTPIDLTSQGTGTHTLTQKITAIGAQIKCRRVMT